jgi:hypothetical protein
MRRGEFEVAARWASSDRGVAGVGPIACSEVLLFQIAADFFAQLLCALRTASRGWRETGKGKLIVKYPTASITTIYARLSSHPFSCRRPEAEGRCLGYHRRPAKTTWVGSVEMLYSTGTESFVVISNANAFSGPNACDTPRG